jgi:PAS domain S-box-containing protein
LIALVAAAVLPTLIAATATLFYAYKEEREGFQDRLRDTTRALALVVDREIARREAIALTLAGSPTLTRGDLQAFHEYATQIAPTRDKVVVLNGLDGVQLVNTRVPFGTPLPKTSTIAPERDAVGPVATLVSNVYFAPLGKQYSFAVQVPVVRDGKPIYYLSLAGFASAMQSVLDDQRVPSGWTTSILDAKGVVVARNIGPEKFVGRQGSALLLAQMARGAEGAFESVSIEGTPIWATFSKSPNYGWSVVVGVPLTAANAPLRVVATFAVLAALLLLCAVLAALAIARRLLQPVRRLQVASESVGSGRVGAGSTGLLETDQVLAGLRAADERIVQANRALEARRAEAVAAAEALRISEERLRQLANTIPNLAWMADGQGELTWYNERWYDYTGTLPEEMKGWGWQRVHHPDTLPEVVERWKQSLRTGEPFEMPFVLLRGRDGVFRPFFTRVVPLRDASGAIVQWFGTNTDVSSLKQAQEELREADRRKDEFLATLAHELRNPLAPIRTAAELLKRVPTQHPQVAKASEIIARQVGHMGGLLSDLLDVSRITRGLVTLETERVRIERVVAAALEQVRPLLDGKQHQVEVVQPDFGLEVLGSPLRLTQVVANLLDNAAKYSPAGSRIRIEVRGEAGRVVIVVADNGQGIAAELLPRVFEPFTQAERGAHRSDGGLGLGLAVVKGLVELQGGHVRAESAGAGQGSTFVIDLPAAPAGPGSPAAEGGPGPTAPASSQPVRPLRLLVVDDNRDAADTLAALLEGAGHRVESAYTASAALARVRAAAFDAAILDIGLPDMSGYALASELRATGHVGALIALSGYGQDSDRLSSAEAGFDHHFVKPVEPEQLLAALSTGGDAPGTVP